MSNNWKITDHRFVLLVDILGFRNIVNDNEHHVVFKFLKDLHNQILRIEDFHNKTPEINNFNFSSDQSKSFVFSDTICFFTKSNEVWDCMKILWDASLIINSFFNLSLDLNKKVFFKGAISYGEISIDKKNNLIVGKPIISAYEAQEKIKIMGIVTDEYFDGELPRFMQNSRFPNYFKNSLISIPVPIKSKGKICKNNCKKMNLIAPYGFQYLKSLKSNVEMAIINGIDKNVMLYYTNTIQMYDKIIPKI